MSARAVIAILAALCALLFFGRLGATSLWDIDETSNARAAAEMLERGDLVVPTVNGELRTDKPPLHYWFMMAAYRLLGENEFAARLGAAVFATATVLMMGAVGCAWYGAAGGLVAGLSLAGSLLFSFSSRSATTDAFLVFFTAAAALSAFSARSRTLRQPSTALRQAQDEGSGPGAQGLPTGSGRGYALLAWTAAGLAVLAKGPVGVMLPAGTALITAVLLGEGRARRGSWLRTLLWPPGIMLFLALALPWYLLAAARTGGDLAGGFLLTHNLGRFLSPMQSHRGPFFYYLPVLLMGFFPFAALLPQAVAAALGHVQGPGSKVQGGNIFGRALARIRESDPRGVFLAVWAALVVLLFSFSGTKLPTYILPAFPALALMTGALGAALAAGERPRGMTVSWSATLVTAFAFPVAAHLALAQVAPGQEDWALWLGAGSLLAALLPLAAHLARRPIHPGGDPGGGRGGRERSPLEPLLLAAAGGALFVAVLHQAVAPGLEHSRTVPVLGRIIRATAGPGDEAACLGYYRPSLVFYAGRRVERLRTAVQAGAFLDRGQGRYLVTTGEEWDRLPGPVKAHLRPLWAGPDFPDSPRTVMLAVNGWGR